MLSTFLMIFAVFDPQHRDFKFGTLIYHRKSHPADEKSSPKGAWSERVGKGEGEGSTWIFVQGPLCSQSRHRLKAWFSMLFGYFKSNSLDWYKLRMLHIHSTACLPSHQLLSAGHTVIDRYLLPAGRTAANPQQRRANDGTDRQTDDRPLNRPCSAYYAGRVDNTVSDDLKWP